MIDQEMAKRLFKMVYDWGRLGIVVDFTAPAYQHGLMDVIENSKTEWTDEHKKYCLICGGEDGSE